MLPEGNDRWQVNPGNLAKWPPKGILPISLAQFCRFASQ
jgi:hypothetical protein